MFSKSTHKIIIVAFAAMLFLASCASSRPPYGKKRKAKNCDCPTWTYQPVKPSEATSSVNS